MWVYFFMFLIFRLLICIRTSLLGFLTKKLNKLNFVEDTCTNESINLENFCMIRARLDLTQLTVS